ncbi:gamma-aminobutyric acid receptor subunit beta-2-like [Pollicipes pollicipes]|uniref:gamma-aminobutyric acid receptor subunit beta-2-like n=1 Tax=Pollicipes pollicipes TaxID=41117 RepID=UPI001885947F|nr:gamma-aminobutyric acid receptor subunit beta-2-like [Pollicipes pollicipes]
MYALIHCIIMYAMLKAVCMQGEQGLKNNSNPHDDFDCKRGNTSLVDASYIPNDLPNYDRIQECQKRLGPPKKGENVQYPRPCAMQVNVSMAFIDLVAVDVMEHMIMMVITYREKWKDDRIIMPPALRKSCSGKIPHEKSILLNPADRYRQQIWTPDFYMRGIMGARTSKLLLKTEAVILHENNMVENVVTIKFAIMCPMKFQDFPFDTQKCNITIESYGNFAEDLAIVWGSRKVKVLPHFTSGSYRVSVQTHEPSGVFYGKNVFPQLIQTVMFRRRRFKYLLLIYVPSSLHFFIAWLAFFLPKEVSQGRCIISCTTNLSLVSMLSIYMRYSPHGGYVKALDMWVFCSIVLQFACTLDSIVDIRLLYLATGIKRRPMEANTAEVLDLVTDTSHWLGREVRLVETEDEGGTLAGAARDLRTVAHLSAGLASRTHVAEAEETKPPAASVSGEQTTSADETDPGVSTTRGSRHASFADETEAGVSTTQGSRHASFADETDPGVSTSQGSRQVSFGAGTEPIPEGDEQTSRFSQSYYQFLTAVIVYQEWSQYTYLAAYMVFLVVYWCKYVPAINYLPSVQ